MSEDHDASAPSAAEEHDSVEDRSVQRKNERAETVENILEEVDSLTRDQKFPVSSEELATEYANQPSDLTNESESLGSVFDRLDDRREFDSAEEVREAVYGEITGEAGGPGEYNEERDLQELAEDVTDEDGDANAN